MVELAEQSSLITGVTKGGVVQVVIVGECIVPSRNPNGKYRADSKTDKLPDNYETAMVPNQYQPGQSGNKMAGRKDWHVGMPWDPDWGENPYSGPPSKRGRPKKGEMLTDLINAALDEEVDVYYGPSRLDRLTRRKIWARHIADLMVFGQTELPSPDALGQTRVVKFSADTYAKHAIRLMRYLEPPVPDVVNPSGVTNIIFDVPVTIRTEELPQSKTLIMLQNTNQDQDSATNSSTD